MLGRKSYLKDNLIDYRHIFTSILEIDYSFKMNFITTEDEAINILWNTYLKLFNHEIIDDSIILRLIGIYEETIKRITRDRVDKLVQSFLLTRKKTWFDFTQEKLGFECFEIYSRPELDFEEVYEFNIENRDKESSLNVIAINPMDSFFACAKNDNQVVETKNVDLKIKKYNSFSNAKKCNLSYDKNIFSNGSAAEKVGPFFDYVKRYISTIKSYFDYFIEKKYKCRIFAT